MGRRPETGAVGRAVEPQETEPRSGLRAMGRQIHRRGRLNFVVFLLRYKIKLPKGQLIIAAY